MSRKIIYRIILNVVLFLVAVFSLKVLPENVTLAEALLTVIVPPFLPLLPVK